MLCRRGNEFTLLFGLANLTISSSHFEFRTTAIPHIPIIRGIVIHIQLKHRDITPTTQDIQAITLIMDSIPVHLLITDSIISLNIDSLHNRSTVSILLTSVRMPLNTTRP